MENGPPAPNQSLGQQPSQQEAPAVQQGVPQQAAAAQAAEFVDAAQLNQQNAPQAAHVPNAPAPLLDLNAVRGRPAEQVGARRRSDSGSRRRHRSRQPSSGERKALPENTIAFVHTWHLEDVNERHLPPMRGNMRDAEVITTIYNNIWFEWNVYLTRNGPRFDEEMRIAAGRQRSVQKIVVVEPSFRAVHVEIPHVHCVMISLKVKDSRTFRDILNIGPTEAHTVTQNDGIFHDISYQTRAESQLGQTLAKLKTAQLNSTPERANGSIIELTTTLFMDPDSFKIGDIPRAAKAVPPVQDFRFNSINQKARHDFTFKCSGGKIYMASKEALYISAVYFRNHFKDIDTPINEIDETTKSVEAVVVFMITGFFDAPKPLTPALCKEIHDLCDKYRPIASACLRYALEKEACNYLPEIGKSLKSLVQWLIVSNDYDMQRFFNSCMATIVSKYYNEYLQEYGRARILGMRRHLENTRLVTRTVVSRTTAAVAPSDRANQLLEDENIGTSPLQTSPHLRGNENALARSVTPSVSNRDGD
ncbi:hypothetical protein WR25_16126 [Diploscapter pachys]|uniref:BTB domain-containing protein n=1 Tax=Diploscapter pachys TaxID=2018661 RepID=A0A2A2LBE5_9BILA|nr:hypothetical protein WR25_16126 [Diploscapter pachys]